LIINPLRVQVADKIRPTVDKYSQAFPALLEIPSSVPCSLARGRQQRERESPDQVPTFPSWPICSKTHPYDPEKDSVLKRVRKLAGDD